MTAPQSAPSQWAPPPPVVNPGLPGGLTVAGMGPRFGAYIIDAIILAIVGFIFVAILAAGGLWITRTPDASQPLNIEYNYPALLIDTVFGLAVSFAYWIYSWSTMRASIGMRALNLQIGDAATGSSLTRDQAVRRWVALGAPFALLNLVAGVPALVVIGEGVGLVWLLALLITTFNNPLRQGLHDRFARSLIVQAR
jgi:uncharacterized RDD family membrane protein YckC